VSELSDYSVCTTWGVHKRHLYLLDVFRKRLEYPELKRAIRQLTERFGAKTVLIEDKASGTQLIQELTREGLHVVKAYKPEMDKVMRLHSVTATLENGFVHVPDQAAWKSVYIHELTTFPKGKHDDQTDSTSQALDWVKRHLHEPGIITFMRWESIEDHKLEGRWEEARKEEEELESLGLPPCPSK